MPVQTIGFMLKISFLQESGILICGRRRLPKWPARGKHSGLWVSNELLWLAVVYFCCHNLLLGGLVCPVCLSLGEDTWERVPSFLWTYPLCLFSLLVSPISSHCNRSEQWVGSLVLQDSHGTCRCSWELYHRHPLLLKTPPLAAHSPGFLPSFLSL